MTEQPEALRLADAPDRDPNRSLCEDCSHLEVWPKVIGGTRYLCIERAFSVEGSPNAFGRHGRDTVKGVPIVNKCALYSEGRHYSRKKNEPTRSPAIG